MNLVFEVLVDQSEKPHKCSILPLSDHPDFRIRRFSRGRPISRMTGHFFLHPGGEDLAQCMHRDLAKGFVSSSVTNEPSDLDRKEPWVLSVIDCNWRRLPGILQKVDHPVPRPVKIPEGFVTAYPRRNRHNLDPEEGLATIEAIFIAAAFLGRYDESLLDRYHWKKPFLEMNQNNFNRHGLAESSR
jgi:ribosome biogenesis protein Tsr3